MGFVYREIDRLCWFKDSRQAVPEDGLAFYQMDCKHLDEVNESVTSDDFDITETEGMLLLHSISRNTVTRRFRE